MGERDRSLVVLVKNARYHLQCAFHLGFLFLKLLHFRLRHPVVRFDPKALVFFLIEGHVIFHMVHRQEAHALRTFRLQLLLLHLGPFEVFKATGRGLTAHRTGCNFGRVAGGGDTAFAEPVHPPASFGRGQCHSRWRASSPAHSASSVRLPSSRLRPQAFQVRGSQRRRHCTYAEPTRDLPESQRCCINGKLENVKRNLTKTHTCSGPRSAHTQDVYFSTSIDVITCRRVKI